MPRRVEPAVLLPTHDRDPLDALCAHYDARPLLGVLWTPAQLAYLQCTATRKLLRAGNQIGKSWAGLADVIWRALGLHPYRYVRPPPVEIWVVCTTWPQSVAIMRKFWDLAPKEEIASPRGFDPRYGFGKDNPAVIFRNGSIVRFRTTNQGAEALAGATIDYVLIDEPTDEEIYRELDRRVARRSGDIGLTLTPVNRPVEYLRDLVASGAVVDLHYRLTPDVLIPVGSDTPLTLLDGTPMDAAWIAEQRRIVLPRHAPVVLDGEWDTAAGLLEFPAFDPHRHVREVTRDGFRLHLGWDHGEGDYREVSVLAGVAPDRDDRTVAVALAEYAGDGMSTPDVDAEGTLDALEAAGCEWYDLRSAIGDKPTQGRLSRRSNADLARALERAMKQRRTWRGALRPGIEQAKTGRGGGAGSVGRGKEWLHRLMVDDRFHVHPRCERLIESLSKWTGGKDEEWKDACDALRYAVWPYAIRETDRQAPPTDWRTR